MRPSVFFVVSCLLALHSGHGAPRTAVYKFVRCNPEGDQANCVTQQSPKMAWSPELPAKLPASTARYLEAEPEEGESPPREEEEELEMYEDEKPRRSEEGESPVETDGSGGYEGSAGTIMAGGTFGETGSGESWAEKEEELYKDGNVRRLFQRRSLFAEAKPAEQELREDQLLQL